MSSCTWLENAVRDLLKAGSYRKRRLTWHRLTPESVLVFNFRKSSWSDLYYLNLQVP